VGAAAIHALGQEAQALSAAPTIAGRSSSAARGITEISTNNLNDSGREGSPQAHRGVVFRTQRSADARGECNKLSE
jgi:hypothetical protein